jgi:Ca2+:H+ antiporter
VAATGAPAISSAFTTPSSEEAEKDKPRLPVTTRFWTVFKKVIFHSWVNVLLVFVPVGIAVHFAGINPNIVFALNAIAIIPLAGLLTYATESVAHRLGPTLGALLNVSFGNAVELIIFIIALVKNEIRIVQASLIGSILANLLILGMAFLVGGLEYQEQIYDSTVTQMSACLLALAVLSLLVPTAFHASFNDNTLADKAVLKLSRGTSVHIAGHLRLVSSLSAQVPRVSVQRYAATRY